MTAEITFRKHPRAKWHEYNHGIYFVTFCTENKRHCFGKVIDCVMILNDKGRIVEECINSLPLHYPDVEVHNHIVMPNHIHLLLQIVPSGVEGHSNYGAIHAPQHDEDYYEIPFDLRCHFNSRLAMIVCGLKSAATKRIRSFDVSFGWQSRYHDHVVRDQHSYDNITTYISENPMRWDTDTFNRQG